MRRYPVRQMKKLLKPVNLSIAVVLNLVPSLGPADDRAKRYEKDCIKAVFLGVLHAWVTDGSEKIYRRVGMYHTLLTAVRLFILVNCR